MGVYQVEIIEEILIETLKNKDGTNLTDLELPYPMAFLPMLLPSFQLLDLICTRTREKGKEVYNRSAENTLFIDIRSRIN